MVAAAGAWCSAMGEGGRNTEHLLRALQERAKELGCLYDVEEALKRANASLPELFQAILQVLPPGWQYPQVCQARIEYGGSSYRTEGFRPSAWEQTADIVVQDRVVGCVAVSYREERPRADEGPFLREEGKLIRTIADRLGHFILHQKLKEVFQEWHLAKETMASSEGSEWRFALNLFRRTDPDLFVRISWKLANHLAWRGIPEAQALLQGFGQDEDSLDEAYTGEKNQPLQKRPLDLSLTLGDKVTALAAQVMDDAEILSRIQNWIQEDRAAFLVKTVVAPQASPGEIADALRRYQHVVQEGGGLPPSTLMSVRVNLIRRFLSDQLDYLKVAKEFVGLEAMLGLLERMIHLPGTQGRLGGKCAGQFLAAQILWAKARQRPELGDVKVPRTWFIASDAVLGFIRYNNLEEVYEQKYKNLDEVRREYPHLVRVFQNSRFPPEIVKGLSVALDDFGEVPLIVRSSSLLEDRLGAAFSGKYKSLFLPNQGSKRERFAALLDAIAEVYASIFSPDPIHYRAERGLLDFREEMGVMIQEVVGRRMGKYFLPTFAGVAFSHNEFRWSPRIRREDGLLRLVPGLGTRAVDRVGDDYPVLLAPGQPRLRVNVTVDEITRYSPQQVDVLDLEARSLVSLPWQDFLKEVGAEYPHVHRIISVREGDRMFDKPPLLLDFDQDSTVVTFEGLIQTTPFVAKMESILTTLAEVNGHPVDLEFASDGQDLYLTQCRPQGQSLDTTPMPVPKDVPPERVLFTARRYVANGRIPELSHIVYVDCESYRDLPELADYLAVGRAVGRLNALLPRRRFILVGPGRWGSRGDVKQGVPVGYADINHTAMLVEMACRQGDYAPDLSFGTHFFQDLVEASIRYLPLYPEDPENIFNTQFFREAPNELPELVPEYAHLAGVLKVIEIRKVAPGLVLRLHCDAEQEEAMAFLVEPDKKRRTRG